uniref:Uncharacterized protein n=1 Tax=Leersia perrieri TaxID=77586 RepID=A0A0D9VF30_9ORYZ
MDDYSARLLCRPTRPTSYSTQHPERPNPILPCPARSTGDHHPPRGQEAGSGSPPAAALDIGVVGKLQDAGQAAEGAWRSKLPPLRSDRGGVERLNSDVTTTIRFVKLPRIGLNIGNIAMSAKPSSGSTSEMAEGENYTVGEKDGVIIVDHGSRRQESNLMLNDFVAMFRARTGYKIVEPAHMELAEPTIKDAFGKCVQQGASRVIVSPYFLSPGRHWKQDIPALAAEASKEHSDIPFIVTAPLGLHELMVDIMNDRIKYCLRHVVGDVDECRVCAGTGKCRLYS